MTCSRCNGRGYIPWLLLLTRKCPECSGTGEILCKEQIPDFEKAFKDWVAYWTDAKDYPKIGCLTLQQIVSYADSTMGRGERRGVDKHIKECPYCLLQTMKAQAEFLQRKNS